MTDEQPADPRQVAVQKIYIKDSSLEVPNAPEIFTKEWKPSVDVQLNTAVQNLSDDTHNVVITVTVTAKLEDETAYLAEVQQAGVFLVRGFDNEGETAGVLGAYCPNLLFPFARESIADLVAKAGFPHFLLQPVNFDALYQQHVEKNKQAAEGATKH